jgi:hypothetical protein
MPGPSPVPWLDDEMRDRAGDRIHDHAAELPADPVAPSDLTANPELRGFAHRRLASVY